MGMIIENLIRISQNSRAYTISISNTNTTTSSEIYTSVAVSILISIWFVFKKSWEIKETKYTQISL